ncbi:MAG: GNAT family N-acetyltransferase [Bacteroidetes bacterium]|nr:GNAT family N-acetyltransferase [Bacteroidota bacterium]
MKVIRVTKDDISTIENIVNILINNTEKRPTSNHLRQLLIDNRTYLFAAFFNEDVIGYALAYKFPSLYSTNYLAYLYDIEVAASHRRKGVGRLLIGAILGNLKGDNVSEVFLGTATDNLEGQALFSATGGVKSGETFNDFTYELL